MIVVIDGHTIKADTNQPIEFILANSLFSFDQIANSFHVDFTFPVRDNRGFARGKQTPKLGSPKVIYDTVLEDGGLSFNDVDFELKEIDGGYVSGDLIIFGGINEQFKREINILLGPELNYNLGDTTDDILQSMLDWCNSPDNVMRFPMYYNEDHYGDSNKTWADEEDPTPVEAYINHWVPGGTTFSKNSNTDPGKRAISPWFHLVYIIQEIFKKLGFQTEGNFFTNPEIATILIPSGLTLDRFYQDGNVNLQVRDIGTKPYIHNSRVWMTIEDADPSDFFVDFALHYEALGTYLIEFEIFLENYTQEYVDVDFDEPFAPSSWVELAKGRFGIFTYSGTPVHLFPVIEGGGGTQLSYSTSINIDATLLGVQLEVRFVKIDSDYAEEDPEILAGFPLLRTFVVDASFTNEFNPVVTVQDHLPDITLNDALLDIMQTIGCNIIFNPFQRSVEFDLELPQIRKKENYPSIKIIGKPKLNPRRGKNFIFKNNSTSKLLEEDGISLNQYDTENPASISALGVDSIEPTTKRVYRTTWNADTEESEYEYMGDFLPDWKRTSDTNYVDEPITSTILLPGMEVKRPNGKYALMPSYNEKGSSGAYSIGKTKKTEMMLCLWLGFQDTNVQGENYPCASTYGVNFNNERIVNLDLAYAANSYSVINYHKKNLNVLANEFVAVFETELTAIELSKFNFKEIYIIDSKPFIIKKLPFVLDGKHSRLVKLECAVYRYGNTKDLRVLNKKLNIPQKPFIFSVTVGNNESFELPLVASGNYNMSVNWGDTNTDNITAWDQTEISHTYSVAGTYDIEISGQIEGWSVNNYSDRNKIIEVKKWGPLLVGDQGHWFEGCNNLVVTATDVLNTSGVTSFASAFYECTSLTEVPRIGMWDTSTLENLNLMFYQCHLFNQNLNDWDTSSVTNMTSVFWGCSAFNEDITFWNTSSVTSMLRIFEDCILFNQNISGWNVSSVEDMSSAFSGCTVFNQDIGGWDTSSVTSMSSMFHSCVAFNQDLGLWNTSLVESTSRMFQGCSVFNQDLDSWDTVLVTSMSFMFYDCSVLNQSLDSWDVSSCTSFEQMFRGCGVFDQHFNNWDVSSCTNFYRMFAQCVVFNQPLPWTLNAVAPISISSMFIDCHLFNGDITGWNTGMVTNTSELFTRCYVFNQDIGSWDVSSVSLFSNTLAGGVARGMFSNCTAFNQDISSWITTSATNMSFMFEYCAAFNQDISSWNMSTVTRSDGMFRNCDVFNQDLSVWDMSSVTEIDEMFRDCPLFDQDLSSWDISSVQVANSFLLDSGISTANYDLILNAWSLLSVQPGVSIEFSASFTIATSQAARDILTGAPNNWSILDEGGV